MDEFYKKIFDEVKNDTFNKEMSDKGYQPIFSGTLDARALIIGQAPGIKAQLSQKPWDDLSGDRLRGWLGVSAADFYNEEFFSLLPMDFYYPGKGKTGDLPTRKGFADKWHTRILEEQKGSPLKILIGQYSQNYYLESQKKKTLTERVRNYKEYTGRGIFVLPHPSPRNNIWLKKNPWFSEEVLPKLKEIVNGYLND